MGYTHYWKHTKDFTPEQWADITDVAAKLIAATTVDITGWNGDATEPVEITADLIRFNGVADDSHETFSLTRKFDLDGFNFTKTAFKPYDEVVVALLLYLEKYREHIEITSDGDIFDDSSDDSKAANALLAKLSEASEAEIQVTADLLDRYIDASLDDMNREDLCEYVRTHLWDYINNLPADEALQIISEEQPQVLDAE